MENLKVFWQQKRNRTILIVCAVLLVIVLLFWQSFLSTGSHSESTIQQSPQPSAESVAPLNLVPSAPKGADRVAGELLVRFKTGISQAEITTTLNRYHATIKTTISGINTTVVTVPKGQESTILQQLEKEGVVQYSEPNYIRRIQFVPNDTNFTQQWALANIGQTITIDTHGRVTAQKGTVGDDIHAEAAWDVSKGDGVKVAVLDTGIDMSHPDLVGKVVAQKVFVTTSVTTLEDKFGHGTHVAGIIAANTNNGQGVAGVCPNCQLLIGKAMDDQGNGQDSDMANAITWAADNGAKVINMSEGGNQPSQTEDAAIAYAWNKGAVIIAAAGNNGSNTVFYPAASANVVSVAATDNVNALASFSDYGTWVNLAAPGLAILSTLPTHTFGMQLSSPLKTNYDYLSGTSMSAPIVSGVAALVWASPFGTSNSSVVQRLLTTATKIPGTGTDWKDGFVNAAAAVGTSPTHTPTPSTSSGPTVTSNPTPTIGGVQPTLYCLGSCPTPVITTVPQPTTATSLTVSPTSAQNAPTINPCATVTQQSVTAEHSSRHKKHHRNGNSGNGLAKDVFDQLLKLIEFLMQLLNGGSNPGGTPIPTPTPSITPSPTTSPCPSAMPSSTISMSPSVTTGLTPSIATPTTPATISATMTLAPTAPLSPTVALVPTATLAATPIPTISMQLSATPVLSMTPVPSTGITASPTVAPTSTPTNPGGLFNDLISLILKFFQLIINFILSLLKGL